MNRIQKISLSILSTALLAGATLALPAHAVQSQAPSAGAQSPQVMSVSGKITSLSGKTFTLSTSAPSGQQFRNQSQAGSMTFTIDDNTTVSGKLAVGANADVTYRTQNGENIAVSVRVS